MSNKKNRRVVKALFLLIIPLCFSSCTGIADKKIKQCIDERNFEKAYSLSESSVLTSISKNDVAQKEAEFLIDNDGVDAMGKIEILNEKYSLNKDELFSLALAKGDELLCEQLFTTFEMKPNDVLDAAISANMDSMVEMLVGKSDYQLLEEMKVQDYLKENGRYEEFTKEAWKKLYEELSSTRVKGILPPSGVQDSDIAYCIKYDKVDDDTNGAYALYCNTAKEFNKKCDVLLNLAIRNRNLVNARKTITMYRKTIECRAGSGGYEEGVINKKVVPAEVIEGHKVDHNHCYITINYKERDEAKEVLQTAINNGDFKKK